MPDFLKDLTHTEAFVLGGGFAGLGGSLSYMLKVMEGKPFKVGEFFIHIAVSAFFGLIAFEIGAYFGLAPEYCGMVAGSAGWVGTRFARIAEILFPKIVNAVVLKFFGLSKKDLEQ